MVAAFTMKRISYVLSRCQVLAIFPMLAQITLTRGRCRSKHEAIDSANRRGHEPFTGCSIHGGGGILAICSVGIPCLHQAIQLHVEAEMGCWTTPITKSEKLEVKERYRSLEWYLLMVVPIQSLYPGLW